MNPSKNPNDIKIGVAGAGSWGTALAQLLAGKGYEIDLWVFEEDVCEQIEKERENKVFLPGIKLVENLVPSNDLDSVISDKDLLLIVVPSHTMRETTQKMAGKLANDTIVVTASKGIENETLLTMDGVIGQTLPEILRENFAVLSGPSFAREVAEAVPTVVTAASKNIETAQFVQQVFATPSFRVYASDDVIGAELGGSVKNVIAIAAGVIDGLGLGLNTRAALITRGLAEMRRLGLEMGANPRTFTGPAGMGDLVLTCTGDVSRNHTVGKKIGQGKKIKEILSEMRMVAEGVKSAKSIFNLSKKLNVEMPICHEVYEILYNDASPKECLHRLMTRDLRHELDDV
ncbi:NAD(P)H-dependent glycerol-3-phosphate dehydrogenase [Desulfobacterales bacterium HSG16]|nr:NAD(P)H-dependent glycerol-3-phosphate dehydrogenase [Desulfobacterales bacterium HSG16]